MDRLASLHRQFGWDNSFNDGKSIIFAQSGVINGNPFVFGHYLDMEWGEKTYEGTKEISWTEWEKDSNGGFWNAIRKKWRLSRLKAYSRNLDDDSNFTLMSNHEFETWFHAKDRDNEVEFRLLFTPVAQMQMLNLKPSRHTGIVALSASITKRCTAATGSGTKYLFHGRSTFLSSGRATCTSANAVRRQTYSRNAPPSRVRARSAVRSCHI